MSSLISRVGMVKGNVINIKLKVPNELKYVSFLSELDDLVRKYGVEVVVE